MTPTLADARRVVVKIGSALLVDPAAAAPRARVRARGARG
jgi:glutamate 5-kinase